MKQAMKGLTLTALLVFAFGVRSSQADPTDITACGVITGPGSYRLANNLAAAGDCLILSGNHFTIDLNGFTIDGDGTGNGILSGNLMEGLILRNGTLKEFSHGIVFFGTTLLIERMQILGNATIGLASGGNVSLKDSVVSGNGTGVLVDGEGALISGNNISFNTVAGINASSAATVSNNTLHKNGMGVQVSAGSLVTGNTVSFSTTGDGVVADGSSTLSNNIVRSNAGAGLRVTCPSNILDNTATGNPGGNIVTEGPGCEKPHNVAPPNGK